MQSMIQVQKQRRKYQRAQTCDHRRRLLLPLLYRHLCLYLHKQQARVNVKHQINQQEPKTDTMLQVPRPLPLPLPLPLPALSLGPPSSAIFLLKRLR